MCIIQDPTWHAAVCMVLPPASPPTLNYLSILLSLFINQAKIYIPHSLVTFFSLLQFLAVHSHSTAASEFGNLLLAPDQVPNLNRLFKTD